MLEMDKLRLRQDPVVLARALPLQSASSPHSAWYSPIMMQHRYLAPWCPWVEWLLLIPPPTAQASFGKATLFLQSVIYADVTTPHNETKNILTLTSGPTEGKERTE